MADVVTFPAPDAQPEVEQGLRLLSAFMAITDAVARNKLIVLAEGLASADKPDAAQPNLFAVASTKP